MCGHGWPRSAVGKARELALTAMNGPSRRNLKADEQVVSTHWHRGTGASAEPHVRFQAASSFNWGSSSC
jgi:hypothetical protein